MILTITAQTIETVFFLALMFWLLLLFLSFLSGVLKKIFNA
jgi:ABC-type amino acid transport system permease subunit